MIKELKQKDQDVSLSKFVQSDNETALKELKKKYKSDIERKDNQVQQYKSKLDQLQKDNEQLIGDIEILQKSCKSDTNKDLK